MPEILIDSLDDPALDTYRSLRKTNANRFQDVFIAEGINVVERLIRSRFQVESVLVTEAKRDRIQELLPDAVPCLLYTSPSPRDQRGSRMPSSA